MKPLSAKPCVSSHRLLRLAILQASQGFVLPRWLLLPVVFTLFALFIESRIGYDQLRRVPIQTNLWDILPSMLFYEDVFLWAHVLGFALLIGDGLSRARASGSAIMVLLRTTSRSEWWASRIATVGLHASCFVAASTAIILIVGAWTLPFSLGPSPGAQVLAREAMLYPRLPSWPMPLFTFAIAARATMGLWLMGCVLEVVSLLFQRPLAPFLVVVAWIFTSLGVVPKNSGGWITRWLDLTHLISYVDHVQPVGISIGAFLLGWTAVMSALFFLGTLRLRYLDL